MKAKVDETVKETNTVLDCRIEPAITIYKYLHLITYHKKPRASTTVNNTVAYHIDGHIYR